MNNRSNIAASKRQVLHTVCGLFQSSCRRWQREEGSAVARRMADYIKSEACYASPMPRF